MARKKDADKTRIALGLIADQRDYTVANNLKELCRLAEKAGRMGADLFATEEVALTLFTGKGPGVRVPGPETAKIAAIARKHKMYIALGMSEQGKGRARHNSQVFFDRDGRIIATYRKMQLTNGELRGGTVPADKAVLVDTDFARLGCVICYDSQFMEVGRMQAIQGVDLMLFPHVGGAVQQDLIGRALAFGNSIWSATVGRGYCCVCDPRGYTIAEMNKPGDLLVVDCALKRNLPSTNPVSGAVRWRFHQWLERRPDTYAPILGPPVSVESDTWPLYLDNTVAPGPCALSFDLINRSGRPQRGSVRIELPAPAHILTDEYLDWFVDREFGGADWGARPRRFTFDLAPGERRRFETRCTIPADAAGFRFARISGRTREGDDVFWERQLLVNSPVPVVEIPQVSSVQDVATAGVDLPITVQAVGGAANARTKVRLAHDGRNLLLHAQCRRYGPWRDEAAEIADEIGFIVNPCDDLMFWLRLSRNGRQVTQRREKGTAVAKKPPRWSADIKRGDREWTALITVPFAELGAQPRAGAAWRFNVQRSAPLPDALQRKRALSRVVSAHPALAADRHRRGVEWSFWSMPNGRIDIQPRMGWITF